MDENQEYVEREDEFDLNPREDEATPAAAASAAAGANSTGAAGDGCEPDVVDVMGANGGEGVSAWSSDEEEDELRYLPVVSNIPILLLCFGLLLRFGRVVAFASCLQSPSRLWCAAGAASDWFFY